MVGNLKKITVFFKFPTVFLRKKKAQSETLGDCVKILIFAS